MNTLQPVKPVTKEQAQQCAKALFETIANTRRNESRSPIEEESFFNAIKGNYGALLQYIDQSDLKPKTDEKANEPA